VTPSQWLTRRAAHPGKVIAISAVVQAVTLAAAFGALVISIWQGRAAASQSKEAARQSALASASLQRGSFQELVRHGADFIFEALHQAPALLEWFLGSRGLQGATDLENKKYLFLFVRLDMHQANYVAHRDGHLSGELWLEWLNTLRRDLTMAEFNAVWVAVKELYTVGFAALVDDEIAKSQQP
jgi:hypothetical protein